MTGLTAPGVKVKTPLAFKANVPSFTAEGVGLVVVGINWMRAAAPGVPAETVTGASPDALARAGLCSIPEGRGVFPNLTVRENLEMCTFTGTPLATIEEITYARFPVLGQRQHQLAGTMSGGQQQMLAMARALATDPAVLLLDELSMGLAPMVVGQLYELVASIAADGVSVLVVEQFARSVLGIAQRAAIMLNGHIVRTGTPHDIAAELSDAYMGRKAPT